MNTDWNFHRLSVICFFWYIRIFRRQLTFRNPLRVRHLLNSPLLPLWTLNRRHKYYNFTCLLYSENKFNEFSHIVLTVCWTTQSSPPMTRKPHFRLKSIDVISSCTYGFTNRPPIDLRLTKVCLWLIFEVFSKKKSFFINLL